VLDQQPKTLDDALTIATRMEVYSGENSGEDINADRRRVRVVSPARESDADRRIRNLEEYVERQKQEIRELKEAASGPQAQRADDGANSGIGGDGPSRSPGAGQQRDSSFVTGSPGAHSGWRSGIAGP